MKKIIYTRPDGGLSVVVPAPKEAIEKMLGPLTEEEYVAHVLERSIPADATKVRYVNEEDIPSDREFRNAWCDVSTEPCVDIDAEKARDIVLTEVRLQREPLLVKADQDFMRALEGGQDTTEIVEQKKALRDLTEPVKSLALPEDGLATEQLLEQLRAFKEIKIT